MAAQPAGELDPRIAAWIEALGEDRWAVFVLDATDRLVWVSNELKGFLGESDDARIGIGRTFVEALLSPTWRSTMLEESQVEMFATQVPAFRAQLPPEVIEQLPAPFDELVADVEPAPRLSLMAGGFGYVQSGLPQYRVEYLFFDLHDDAGARIGGVGVTNHGMRPRLLSMLARGDEAMYERMARLVTPGRRSAAILFADLEGSSRLSRELPTSRYFEVIRELSTVFDQVVAAECGIVGKHAGDGMTAFFLTEDLGGESAVAAACVRAARALAQAARRTGERLAADGVTPSARVRFKVGMHWGSNLYLGQLVPGGRLDVTALGDAVNECARIQEQASGGELLASKHLVELLDATDAKALGMEPELLSYRPLGQFDGASEKVLRDAATLPVADVG